MSKGIFESVSVLGGAGLVGYQVCRRMLRDRVTSRVHVVSLGRGEVLEAVKNLREEYPEAEIAGFYGNVFARGKLANAESEEAKPVDDHRDPQRRRDLLSDIYEDFEKAKEHSALVGFVRAMKPAAMIDCINTATAISYQDVPTTAKRLMADIGLRASAESGEHTQEDVEALLASIEIPQLILHVRLLQAALTEVGTRIYVKVGTTGTGGMGLNIPYTHGEDKPSPVLMAKNAVAFAQTGLLFLSARSERRPHHQGAQAGGHDRLQGGRGAGGSRHTSGRSRGDRFVKASQAHPAALRGAEVRLARRSPSTRPPIAGRFEIRKGADGKPSAPSS